MKKLLSSLSSIAIIVIVCITSCENENVKKLQQDVKAADRECPINMGYVGDLISIKYDKDDNEVDYYISLHDDMTIDAMKTNKEMTQQMLKLSFLKDDSKELLNEITNANAGISVTYKSATTGKNLKVVITSQELKEIKNSTLTKREIDQLLLANQIAIENSNCPSSIDEGIELVKIYDDGNNIVIDCKIDETIYDMALLQSNRDSMKDNMQDIFKDPSMKKTYKLVKSLNKGFVYHYYGDKSGKSCDIVFTNEEIAKNVR